MKDFTYERDVYYYETDQMGIVHHSNYIRWMEEARLALMAALSLSYAEMEKQGILIPVLSVSCEYKVAFRYGDRFRIQIIPLFFNGIKFKVGYRFYDSEGKLHSTAESGHGFVDASMHPISLKKSCPDIYEKLLHWVQEAQENQL